MRAHIFCTTMIVMSLFTLVFRTKLNYTTVGRTRDNELSNGHGFQSSENDGKLSESISVSLGE